jgi:hypothetical protein
MRETMLKATSDTPSVLHKSISRRAFCGASMAALPAQLLPDMAFGFAADSAATLLLAHRILSESTSCPAVNSMATNLDHAGPSIIPCRFVA